MRASIAFLLGLCIPIMVGAIHTEDPVEPVATTSTPLWTQPERPDLTPMLSKCGKKAPVDIEDIIFQASDLTQINPKLLRKCKCQRKKNGA